MNTIIKKIFYFQLLTIFCLLVGCENIDDEIKELDLSRYLKVQNVKVNSLGGTQVRLDWDQNKIADSYIVEFFADDNDLAFGGEASYILEDIANIDLPYTLLAGLEGNTTYAIRVKAIGQKADDSLWSDGVTVRTAGEQLLYTVNKDEITHESAIIHWVRGEQATHLLVSGGDWSNEQFNISAQNVEDGSYELNGLSPETTYTVKLMNGTKQRGEIAFTTDINPASIVEVTEEDDFSEMINSAEPGTRFYFTGNKYNIGKIDIDKSISIISGGNATISIQITLKNSASLTYQNITLDGMDDMESLDAPVIINTADTHGHISFINCKVSNYSKRLIDANSGSATISAIMIDNCIISNIPGESSDIIDFRSSSVSELTITNSTIYNCGQFRDFIRIDDTKKYTSLSIDKCTFYNVLNTGRLLYIRVANDISFTNNIIAHSNGYFNNQKETIDTDFSKNIYFAADLFMTHTHSNATNDTSGTVINPQFADPDNGDFTVTNDDLKYEGIGDPRWLP